MTKVKEAVKKTPVTEENDNVQLSKEEIAKRRVEVSNFYKENIKHLKVQLEYEKLLTEIDETRAKRLQAQAFMAQAYGPEAESEEEADFNTAMAQAEKPARTLKRT